MGWWWRLDFGSWLDFSFTKPPSLCDFSTFPFECCGLNLCSFSIHLAFSKSQTWNTDSIWSGNDFSGFNFVSPSTANFGIFYQFNNVKIKSL